MSQPAYQIVEPEDLALAENNHSQKEVAQFILAQIMNFRRTEKSAISCANAQCQHCQNQYLPKINAAIAKNKPVTFVLPAFPGKSPNPEKVLSALPDFAEKLSIQFLAKLCQTVQARYAPGMKIIICSDGRVFSDVVGMQEQHVTAYQTHMAQLIGVIAPQYISTFNLDDVYGEVDFQHMRTRLMHRYSVPLESLQTTVRNGAKPGATSKEKEANNMYKGITRFLFEDAIHASQTKSRTALQKDVRVRAYEVIRRSNAWTELIAEQFPDAGRLSIHPQACGSKKLGIRLIANESWLTPWHGVAVATEHGYFLSKRREAERLGAKLIYAADGQPSHYELLSA